MTNPWNTLECRVAFCKVSSFNLTGFFSSRYNTGQEEVIQFPFCLSSCILLRSTGTYGVLDYCLFTYWEAKQNE